MCLRTLRRGLFLLVFWLLAGVPARAAGVLVDEIMYHPASTNRLEAWLEISNAHPNPMDLSGWRVTACMARF